MTEFHKGKYKPKNPNKYVGDANNIVYRSSWELKFMIWCDTKDSVIKWSSEETVIPYLSPIDNKVHRYFVDFKIMMQTNNGIKVKLIEIKPYKQTLPPVKPTRKTKRFIDEVKTFAVNQAKWKAAKKYAQDRNTDFVVLTENELF